MIKHLPALGALIGLHYYGQSYIRSASDKSRCTSRLGFGGTSYMSSGESSCWESRICEQAVSEQA